MRSYRIHSGINSLITFFYRIGFWHEGPSASPTEEGVKLFYGIFYVLFPTLTMGGAIITDSNGECVFLVESSTIATVLFVKLCFLIWKQNEIVDLLNGICIFRIRYDEDCASVDVKLGRFMIFVKAALSVTLVAGVSEGLIIPILSSEKALFYKIAFPWDWRTSDNAYWCAVIFLFIEIMLSVAAFLFSIVLWYIMLNCSLQYEVLGVELRKMGYRDDQTMARKTFQQIFFQDLKALIDNHLRMRKSIEQLESFCFELFVIQFLTSGLCICGSVYCLAFGIGENAGEHVLHLFNLLYNISEIFMITFFGHEIMASSDRLSYSLFESDFVHQPESVKKLMIVFAEYLKQPHELTIGSMYPLTLETFTRVLKGAYSMFNILQNGMQ